MSKVGSGECLGTALGNEDNSNDRRGVAR